MTDCDTADPEDPRPLVFICGYCGAEIDSSPGVMALLALQQTEGWQSRQDIEDHIAVEIGVTVAPSTLRQALRNIREWGQVESRYRNINGSEAREYRRQ